MKITKKRSIKASENINNSVIEQELVVQPECTVIEETIEPTVATCKYQCAIDLISAAIESLAEVAKGDEVAKDSIANLGVVLFDLKGDCCQ